MPLIKIDLIKNQRTPEQVKKLADVVHEALVKTFAAPKRDRYQVITQHEPYEMICEDTGLGFERSEQLVVIQIFQQGRSTQQKQALYAALAETLQHECQLAPTDLIISISANTTEDWSFGYGRAQFLEGDL